MIAGTNTMPVRTQCRYKHHAGTNTMLVRTPCRYEHHAGTNTMPKYTSDNLDAKQIRATFPRTQPTHDFQPSYAPEFTDNPKTAVYSVSSHLSHKEPKELQTPQRMTNSSITQAPIEWSIFSITLGILPRM